MAWSLASWSWSWRSRLDGRVGSQSARTPGARSSDFRRRRASGPAGRGRNHTRWRRAKRRVRRTAASNASSSVAISPARWASTSLVADRLRAPCARPADDAASAAHLVDEPGGAHRGEARLRSGGRARPARSQTPSSVTSIAGGAVVVEPGAERRERPAGQLDHFERAHDAPCGCPVRCAPRPPRIDRLEPRRSTSRRGRASASASSAARVRRIGGRELEVVDDRAHVEARAADEQRPPAPRLDVGDRGARRALRRAHRPLLRRVGDVDQVVRDLGALGRASAWRCRCPCRGTPASSRARRSRRRRAGARAPARARTCPTRSGRRARGGACHTTDDRDAHAPSAGRPDPLDQRRPAASAAPRS